MKNEDIRCDTEHFQFFDWCNQRSLRWEYHRFLGRHSFATTTITVSIMELFLSTLRSSVVCLWYETHMDSPTLTRIPTALIIIMRSNEMVCACAGFHNNHYPFLPHFAVIDLLIHLIASNYNRFLPHFERKCRTCKKNVYNSEKFPLTILSYKR